MIRVSSKASADISARVRALVAKEKPLTLTLTKQDVLGLLRAANHIDRQAEALDRAMAAYREEFSLMADYKNRYLMLVAKQGEPS